MLPRFSRIKQRTEDGDTVLLNMNWGTLVFGVTISRKPQEIDFENELYPHQRIRNFIAIICMVLVHVFLIYFLFFNHHDRPLLQSEKKGQLILLDLPAQKEKENNPKPKKKQQKHQPLPTHSVAGIKRSTKRPATLAAEPLDTTSRIEAARERRRLLEADAAQQNNTAKRANNSPSEDDIAMARIKANIQAANYNRKGTNGIFQILNKGVQTGRFSFRGWTNNPRETTRQTFEVDAGVGGNVELAMIRRMIELIREHYTGDFNWDSHRLNRVVVLSARQADTATLEAFMMKEFFATK